MWRRQSMTRSTFSAGPLGVPERVVAPAVEVVAVDHEGSGPRQDLLGQGRLACCGAPVERDQHGRRGGGVERSDAVAQHVGREARHGTRQVAHAAGRRQLVLSRLRPTSLRRFDSCVDTQLMLSVRSSTPKATRMTPATSSTAHSHRRAVGQHGGQPAEGEPDEHEGHGQAQRIGEQEEDAARQGPVVGGQLEHDAEHRSDTGGPGEREGHAHAGARPTARAGRAARRSGAHLSRGSPH